MSAALSFRTIFALVPALVLAVLVLKSVGVLEDSKQTLRRFLEGSGFTQIAVIESEEGAAETGPDAEKIVNVADEIERIVGRVESKLTFRRVGPVGVVLLIWTALSLLTTMERSLNRIFGAHRARPLGRRLLLYWSVLTLGPLVVLAAAYSGRQVAHTFQAAPGVSWILAAAGWGGPVLVGILVLAAVYKLLPHTAVRYRAAVGGAVIVAPLWLTAKWGFAVYVTKLVGTGNLYGALGLLPLFLVWVNLSWLIFLFGAQLAHTAAHLSSLYAAERSEQAALDPSDLLAAAIAVAEPFVHGHGPAELNRIADRLHLPSESVQLLLEWLVSAKVVCSVGSGTDVAYVPARPPERIPLLELLGVEDARGDSPAARPYDRDISEMVADTWANARSALAAYTLADAIVIDERPQHSGLDKTREPSAG